MMHFMSVAFETTNSVLLQAVFSLRYEFVCCMVFVALWLMGSWAGFSQNQKRTGDASRRGVQTPPKCSAAAARHWIQSESRPREALHPSHSFLTAGSIANLVSILNSMDQALLRDPTWVVPQITHLCRTQFQQALAVYRTAMQAGLKLQDVPTDECRQFLVTLVTSAVRVSQVNEAKLLLKDFRDCGVGVSESLFSSVAKLCTSKRLFADCLAIYDFLIEDDKFSLSDRCVWSCLLFCAIEACAYQRCDHFFRCLKACGKPSHQDYGNMVRLASLHGDWQLSLRLLQEMRSDGMEIDSVMYNTTLATCVSADQIDQGRMLLEEMVQANGVADVITYNTLMKGYVKAGQVDQCFELYDLLQTRNISPSQVTYGILLDGCINKNLLDKAAEVYIKMASDGCQMNTVLFTTLIKGFAKAGEVDQAMKVYRQMRDERSVSPDLVTFSILIKANCDSDRLDKALELLQDMLRLGLKPDEIVFNNLLGGCARQANVALGKRLYADMIASGIHPSNATFSILIRLYHQCKQLEEAVEMLRKEPVAHKVDPEPRLFLQLIISCIRERQGRRAVDVYNMLLERSVPARAAHSSMISTCIKLNMYDTASEILMKAADHAGCVDPNDATLLLEGAVKKRKYQVAAECVASMERMGMSVDRKLLMQVKINEP